MNVDVAAVSDTGRVREANEDSFLVDRDLFIFAVADGMGGHVAGEIASATAIETVRASVAGGIDIETAVRKAHAAVKTKAATDTGLAGMGTTMTALGFSNNNQLVIAHVGDSRAYVLHRQMMDDVDTETAVGELVRITKDHSLVEELVDAGQITEEEANVHPRRSVITRALGIEGDVDVDTTPIPFLKGDRYLLCSDGLSSMVRDEDITEVMRSEKTPNDCARELVSRANQAGGNDNITVVVIDVHDPDIVAPNNIAVAQSVAASEKGTTQHSTKGRVPFLIRIGICVLLFAALAYGAYRTTYGYAHSGYYFDHRKGEVVLMSGRFGGVLGWDPQVNTQTGLEVKNLSPADQLVVKRHARFSSRTDAISTLEKIRERQSEPTRNTTTTTTTTTGVTVPITISEGTSVSSNG